MDRFSQDSPATLQRNWRNWIDRDRSFMDEDGTVDGYYKPVVRREDPAGFEPPYEPLCRFAQRLAADPDLTVGMYSQALSQHKAICPFCRHGRKDAGIEGQADTKEKVA